jgi:hypothetical protein
MARGRADAPTFRSWAEFDLRDGLCDGVYDDLILRQAARVSARA